MTSRLENPEETLSDALSLCAKILHVHDREGKVHVTDLLELRDIINLIRSHVAGGGGYASIPRLVRPE